MLYRVTGETNPWQIPAGCVAVALLVIALPGLFLADMVWAALEYADFPELNGPYLGQDPPGSTAEIFAPGIIKPGQGFHSSVVFNAQGDQAWWTEMAAGRTFQTHLIEGTWTTPEPLPFDPEFGVREPTYGPDGRFYFLSRRPPPDDPVERERIWSVSRTPEGWSAARVIDPVVAAHPTHWQFSFTSRGDLYFTSEVPAVNGEQDIFVARRERKAFTEPTDVGPGVNGPRREFCPFVAADESYIIFSRTGTGGNRRADLFISFRDPEGRWTEAVNLGETVNTEHNEVCPVVTPDGKYLFFLRASQSCNEVYWISTGVIEQLRPRGS